MALLGGAARAVRAAARRHPAGAAVRDAVGELPELLLSILLGVVFIAHRLRRCRSGVVGLIAAQPRRSAALRPPRGRADAEPRTAHRSRSSACARPSAAWSRSTTSRSRVDARRDRRPDRAERLRQDHGAQPDLRRARGRRRRHPLQGQRDLAGLPRIASRGSASRAPSSSCACSASHDRARERDGRPRVPAGDAAVGADGAKPRPRRCSRASGSPARPTLPAGAAHLHRPEAARACARARARAATCCCSTSGSPASTRPSSTTASR